MKQAKCSIIDEQTNQMLYTYTEEYYIAIKQQTFAICNKMDGPRGYYVKSNKTEKDKYCMIHLHVESRNKANNQNKTETDSWMQRTNWWLPNGRQREGRDETGKAIEGTNFQL